MTTKNIPLEHIELARTINGLMALRDNWQAEDRKARERAADATKTIDTYTLERLIDAAATEQARRELTYFEEKIAEAVVVEGEEGMRVVVAMPDPATAEKMLGFLIKQNTESYMRWYLPNSTSNAAVEVQLREHKAQQTLLNSASGRRFF